MKTVTVTQSFTGYPDGKKRDFVKGEKAEVANDFAEMLVEKGLAKESGGKAAKAAEPETESDRE